MMRWMLLLLWVALTGCCWSQASVVELTDATMDSLITSESEWMVLIYADWCGHCRQFKPEFHRLHEKLIADSSSLRSIQLAQVNIDENPGIASRFLVAYLPTVYHIKNREVRQVDFTKEPLRSMGGRTGGSDTLHKFLKDQGWSSIDPWHWFFSPWSPLPRMMGWLSQLVGMLHRFVKSLSAWYPALSQDHLVLALILPMLFSLVWLCWTILSNNAANKRQQPPANVSRRQQQDKKSN